MKPTHPQVTQVTAWRTVDGHLHDSAQKANAHAAHLAFLNWYHHDNQLHSAQTGDRVDGRDLADWLTDNRTAVMEFLMLTADAQKEAGHAV